MSQSYVYSIADDFPNQRVCPETLEDSITTNITSATYEYLNIFNDTCQLFFNTTLSEGDATLLTEIVNTHTGNPPPLPAQEVVLAGDSDAGVARVAVQAAAIPTGSTEFALAVGGELSDGQSVETVSDALPEDTTLRLLFARATCRPMQDSGGVKNVMLVELIYREVVDDEPYDHLFGKTYLDVECEAEFPASTMCIDGTVMVGDGESTFFVIRRTIFGNLDDQDTFVVVRGYAE